MPVRVRRSRRRRREVRSTALNPPRLVAERTLMAFYRALQTHPRARELFDDTLLADGTPKPTPDHDFTSAKLTAPQNDPAANTPTHVHALSGPSKPLSKWRQR